MRIRTIVAAGVVALAALPAATASAEADHTKTLRTICEAQGGTFVPHPFFWRARCSAARSTGADASFARAPFMICTMQMDGTFFSGEGPGDGVTSWVCL